MGKRKTNRYVQIAFDIFSLIIFILVIIALYSSYSGHTVGFFWLLMATPTMILIAFFLIVYMIYTHFIKTNKKT